MRDTVTKYALAFHSDNHGWMLCHASGMLSKCPTRATFYDTVLEALNACDKADKLQDQHHQVVQVQITHDWSWPTQVLRKRD